MLYSNPTDAVKHANAAPIGPDPIADVDNAPRRSFHKNMALTPSEFARGLTNAVHGAVTRGVEPNPSYRIDDGERVVLIHCMAMSDRQVGSLRLPRLDVEIELRGFDDAETERFLNRFVLAFLRMGG